MNSMADADSLHETNSDLDQDLSAIDADDENPEQSDDVASRKKNKKRKRKARTMDKSSGDSDSQIGAAAAVSSMQVEDDDEEEQPKEAADDSRADVYINPPVEEAMPTQVSLSQLQKLQKAMELLKLQGQATPRTMDDAKHKKYQFWDTQPVPKLDEDITTNEMIEPDKSESEIRHEPYSLPQGFHWDTINIGDPIQLKELYTLLNENYVEDDDNMFRFDYSPEFLQWALQPPGWLSDWHCGVRVQKSKKLVGFISAVPVTLKIYEKHEKMVEINFLCVHKKLRSKRVAPVLIREITRRVNCKGIFQAVYTAGVVLPKPVASCRYWHRSLNPRKLIEVKFSHLSRNMTMQRTLKLYKLPESPKNPGFRPLESADVKDVHAMLTKYLNQFQLAPMFSEQEVRHWFTPRTGIVDSYVIEKNGVLTDFVSFYTLPSTVMHHTVHKHLKAAYGFYAVCSSTTWPDLMQDALIVAKNMGFDVFNALDLMDNKKFLEELKFGVGDGNLQYYLYNWRCPTIQPEKVGLVLQ
ncbi:hypothetical protein NP493_333g02028 [Ridgeia piscesae]|uniref:Glycylpeptide N-tetradecanoyltransferase n=1 Tax=Ridgeia piscesae TaxID=27915 RepID=A0AAD9L3T2_RIDPI|nr:hypothetical protein NP493_333g02028 [Ridgeia piscesae]